MYSPHCLGLPPIHLHSFDWPYSPRTVHCVHVHKTNTVVFTVYTGFTCFHWSSCVITTNILEDNAAMSTCVFKCPGLGRFNTENEGYICNNLCLLHGEIKIRSEFQVDLNSTSLFLI